MPLDMTPLSNPEECIAAFQRVRGSMVEAMCRLAATFAANTWKSKASSWSEFVESDLQISQSSASKMLRVHESYLLAGTVKPEEIEGVDIEKLYLARGLEGTIRDRIEKAKLLSRAEIRDTQHEEAPNHTHQPITICSICKKRLE